MPDVWPLNLWGFARFIEPRKCCAYLAWFDIGPFVLVSDAAERRIKLETLKGERRANDLNWALYARAAYDRRAQRLRATARHLIHTVLPHRVRNALRTGLYVVTGVRSDGQRVVVSEEDLAGLSVDLPNDRLTGATLVFEGISVRSVSTRRETTDPIPQNHLISSVPDSRDTEARHAISEWMPLHEAVNEIAEATTKSVEINRVKMWKAIQEGCFPLRGRSADAPSHFSPVPTELVRETSAEIDWNNDELPILAAGAESKGFYAQLEVERESFLAWLFLIKPEHSTATLPTRYVEIDEALNRLRTHLEQTEHRIMSDGDLARVIAADAREGRLKIWWLYEHAHAIPIYAGFWETDRLPRGAPAEKLILNGATKGKRLIFVRRDLASWLGDRPDEANPPPKRLEERDAAPIPLIAREWSREPNAEPEEKIAGRLWRAYFDGEFALQTIDDAPADFDRTFFATMIEVNKEAGRAVLGPTPRDDPEFGYRALGNWAAEDFPGMSKWFRLASVESYLLPRSALDAWCRRARQRMPRFWQLRPGAKPRVGPDALPARHPAPQKAVREWYTARVVSYDEAGTQPSRDDDYHDAVQKFGDGVTHEMVRSFRSELAPHWTKPGRRPFKTGGK